MVQFFHCDFIFRYGLGLMRLYLSNELKTLPIQNNRMFSCDKGSIPSINQQTVNITLLLPFSSGGSFVTFSVSQPLSEVLIPGPPGMWELSGVLAILDMLTGRTPTANNDRIQSPLPRGFAVLHVDIILGSLAANSAVVRLLRLFWAPLWAFSIPLCHLCADMRLLGLNCTQQYRIKEACEMTQHYFM